MVLSTSFTSLLWPLLWPLQQCDLQKLHTDRPFLLLSIKDLWSHVS